MADDCLRRIRSGLLAFLVASIAYPASGQYLVTSFENPSDLFTPLADPPLPGTPTVALSSQYGVTQGTNSMEVVPTGFDLAWLSKMFGPETYAQWFNHQTLAFDFTRVTTTAGNYELLAAINGPTTGTNGWNQKQLVAWAWQNGGLNRTQTITWDYGSILATSPQPGSGTSADFWQLSFMARTNPSFAPQYGYIDNVRFINPLTPPDFIWAGNGSTAGGTGYWSTLFEDATWLANGQGSGVKWDPYARAAFRGPGGTVTVSGTVVARNGLQFDTTGYTVVSDTATTYGSKVEMAGGTLGANTISVASGVAATMNATMMGSNGFTKSGAGTLVLGAGHTITGTALVSAGTLLDQTGLALSDASIVVVPGGTYQTPAGTAVDAASLRLAGGTLAIPKLNVTTGLNAGVMINDFETTADLYDPTASMTNIALSTTAGVTSGTAAMGMTWGPGSDYDWSFKSYDPAALEAWKAHKTIAIDVTQVNSGTATGRIAGNIAFNGPMGWNQTGNSSYPRFINYASLAAGGSSTTTYYWDYSAIQAGGDETWFQISLAGALGAASEPLQQVFFDNMRVVNPVVPTEIGVGNLVIESGTIAGNPDLAVFNGGRMSLPTGSRLTLNVNSLSVTETGTEAAGGGQIDIGKGRINVAAGGITEAALRADLIAGRGTGSFSGSTGIMTTGGVAGSASQPVVGYRVLTSGSAIVAWSAFGDANLDGQVNQTDINLIVTGGKFGQGASSNAVWVQGDFNYSGGVTQADINQLVGAGLFGQGSYLPTATAALGDMPGVAAVPEPTVPAAMATLIGLMGLGWTRLARRRR